jgi:hypothetical protein
MGRMSCAMNQLNVEQAVAALVNHYVAASVGLVSEDITASHAYRKIAFLFTYPGSGSEKVKRPVTGNPVKVRKPYRKRVGSSRDVVVVDQKASEEFHAFFLFSQQRIAAVSQEVSSEVASGTSQVSTARRLNEMWASLSLDEKNKYIAV